MKSRFRSIRASAVALVLFTLAAAPVEARKPARLAPTPTPTPKPTSTPIPTATPTTRPAPTATPSGLSFQEGFDTDGTIEETGSMSQSANPSWWTSSGGRLIKSGGLGHTIQGELPSTDKWRVGYSQSNPLDTDNGYHPQNIFRFVARSRWRNLEQQVNFRVNRYIVSASPNRNASNGVLLFNRYQDSMTLYYVGIRVDGAAVIKKKLAGTYTTLGLRAVFPGTYNINTNPNLLPTNRWLGLKSVVFTNSDGSVTIQMWLDQGSGYALVLEATDTGKSSGAAILADGYGGIRTDFGDVDFEDYRIRER